jgi:hypothetical protein
MIFSFRIEDIMNNKSYTYTHGFCNTSLGFSGTQLSDWKMEGCKWVVLHVNIRDTIFSKNFGRKSYNSSFC